MEITHDAERAEYIRRMGPELGLVCHELQDDSGSLIYRWSELQELFRGGPERFDLLNSVASNFFHLVSQVMYEDAILHLCRLTDRPEVFGNEILTVKRLPKLISDPTLKIAVHTKVDDAWARCEFARRWRHEKLAHTNLETFRLGVAAPLPAVTAEHISDAIKAIRDILTSIGDHFGLPHNIWTTSPWGSRALVACLEHDRKLRDQEHAEWQKLVNEGKK
jgi:hypothetical protein